MAESTNLLTMTAENYHDGLPEEELEEFYGYPPQICLIARIGPNMLMKYIPEEGRASAEWLSLAIACENGIECELNWMPSNGDTSIWVKEGGVMFISSNYGSTRGGSMRTFLPASVCAEAFRKAATITEEWLAKSSK